MEHGEARDAAHQLMRILKETAANPALIPDLDLEFYKAHGTVQAYSFAGQDRIPKFFHFPNSLDDWKRDVKTATDLSKVLDLHRGYLAPLMDSDPIEGETQASDDPTGWPDVDAKWVEVRQHMNEARYGEAGLLMTGALLQTALAAGASLSMDTNGWDEDNYVQKLELIIDKVAGPRSERQKKAEPLKRSLKAAKNLAQNLKHDGTSSEPISPKDARLACEASRHVITMLRILVQPDG